MELLTNEQNKLYFASYKKREKEAIRFWDSTTVDLATP